MKTNLSPRASDVQTRSKKNNSSSTVLRFIYGFILFYFFLFSSMTELHATHFRGGNLNWQQAGGNSITFTINTTWRYGFSWSTRAIGGTNNIGNITFGDATSASVIATVNAVDIANDIIFMTWTFTKTYAAPGNYNVSALNSCCRISTLLDNNNDKDYRLQTTVNVGGPPFNNAPVSTLPRIVNLPINAIAATFTVPATDPDNDPLTFRLATTTESGMPTISPAGFSLTSAGVATMNTVGRSIGQLFSMQIMVMDGKTRIPVDFLIQMVGQSQPPQFISPTPANNFTFNVTPPGVPVNFIVSAVDPDANQTTTLNSIPLPLGASMSPSLPVTGPIGGPISSTFSWTPTAAQVGTYLLNFVAQDNVGIQSFRTVRINVLCPLSVSESVTNVTCYGDANGAIDITVNNASNQSNLRFLWSGPGGFSATTEDVSALSSGNYNVRVDDIANGCFVIRTITVSSPEELIAVCSSSDVSCYGASDGSASVSVTGGDGAYSYLWSDGSFASSLSGLSVGTYTVMVSDGAGCSATCYANVEGPAELLLDCKIIRNVTCNGGSDGEIEVAISGGTGPFQVLWSNGQPGQSISGLNAGTYSVYVTDANGCTASCSITITEPMPLSATTNVVNATCPTCPNGSVEITSVSGGTAPYVVSPAYTQTGLLPGSYCFTITDANSCSITVCENVSFIACDLSVSLGSDRYVLYGTSTYNGCTSITPTITYGQSPFTYSWSSVPVGVSSSASVLNVCNTSETTITYNVTVTDFYGCTASASVNVEYVNINCSNNSNSVKVKVCHRPPANPQNCQTICVSENSPTMSQMLNTGSYLGKCRSNCAPPNQSRMIAPGLDETEIFVYPNPSTDRIQYDFKSPESEVHRILIKDLKGSVIIDREFDFGNQFITEFDVSSFDGGIYFIMSYENDELISVSKFLKAN
ncbi:MAG: hypothetical protein DWQ48_00160 [Bacteroidetes bacterium]|nr:MAG: hypothetical protein DWQ48_00160 [Bacteroidota bacterium]